jgi:hypothetical protein
MVSKAFSSGSAVAIFRFHLFSRGELRRGPRNDMHVIQRVGWTNVRDGVVLEQGADIYE